MPNAPMELVGKQVLGVQVIRRLAHGEHTEVWQGEHLSLGRPVALKVYESGYQPTEDALRRFISHAEVLSALEHPNLVAFLDAGKHEDCKVLVQAYVEGETLEARLKRQGVMEPTLAAMVFREVARGLEALHATGLGHGDVRPGNVLLSKKGETKVSDFGIALAVPEAGDAPGTAEYLAPEWTMDPNPPADMYSFGVMLFRVMTGRLPFEGDAAAVVAAHREQPPPDAKSMNPAIPDRIAALIARCLDKNPGLRPTAGEAAFELDLAGKELRGEAVPGASAPPPPSQAGAPVDAAVPGPPPAATWSMPTTTQSGPSDSSIMPGAEAASEVRESRAKHADAKAKPRERGYVPSQPMPEAKRGAAPPHASPDVKRGVVPEPSGHAPVIAPIAKPTQSYGGYKPKKVSKLPKVFVFLLLIGGAGAASYWGWKKIEPMLATPDPGAGGGTAPVPPQPPPVAVDPVEKAREELKQGRVLPVLVRMEAIVKEKDDRAAAQVMVEAGRRMVGEMKNSMVYVPGGWQQLGGTGGRAWVRSFMIDAREVTCDQYARFLEYVKAKGHALCHPDEPADKSHVPPGFKLGSDNRNLPVTRVDWWDAWAYAAWQTKRLPFEAEWERAATWTPDGPVSYPWGADWKSGAANIGEGDGSIREAAGGAFLEDRSGCWAEDMGGNVSEWCYDWSAALPPPGGPPQEHWWGPTSGTKRVVRGPSWGSNKTEASLWRRWEFDPGERSDRIGFRCAKDLKRD